MTRKSLVLAGALLGKIESKTERRYLRTAIELCRFSGSVTV